MMFDFTGRTLVLTGANGGIGRAVADVFSGAGANLVLADLDGPALDGFAATLEKGAARIATKAMDVSQPEDAEALIRLACERFGAIDYLIPSAGIYLAEPFAAMTGQQWRRTLSINLDGVFYLCNRAVPHLSATSAIVNLTSVAAHRGAVTNAHYAASKGALGALTRSLARELAPRTRVNAVAPGVIETPMTVSLVEERGTETLANTPLGRLGKPSEIAAVIAFLCSPAASFVTGETIHVNGGLYMA
ncbi:SDR family oxidoreductase [Pseudaminobacter arsenicus]|uniref:SDR family oxidoreductase n=1 Tax=Borborobacter arsenicus TaxID=1851146 RepID=A0A432V1J1_9HYPH|nr:SDR family NAD(P)-dependent oxidoreductase [Pseudaminobacter arsenicus]RUM96021.1 SDR family oxidoreductase [Pseudaminobacter arsenicus]